MPAPFEPADPVADRVGDVLAPASDRVWHTIGLDAGAQLTALWLLPLGLLLAVAVLAVARAAGRRSRKTTPRPRPVRFWGRPQCPKETLC